MFLFFVVVCGKRLLENDESKMHLLHLFVVQFHKEYENGHDTQREKERRKKRAFVFGTQHDLIGSMLACMCGLFTVDVV